MFGSQTLHPWCHSILIFPLDQAIHPLVRCKTRPQGGDFQRQSLKLRYQTDRYKCTSSTHALYGSRTRHPSCESVLIIPLDQAIDSPVRWEILEHVEFNGKVWNYAIQRTDTSVRAAHMHCMGHWYAIRGVKACSSFRWIKQFTHLSVAKLIESNLLVSSDIGPE